MADPGDTLHFSAELFDKAPEDGGVPSNASTVDLTIALPDGTTVSATVVNPPANAGEYFYDYTTSTLGPFGRYEGQWVFTLAGGRTESFVQVFDVGAALITVDEAIAHLRAAGVIKSAPDLEQLQWLCLVATDAIEADLGRVLAPRTVVETRNGGSGVIVLRKAPVVSVASVLESGSTLGDYVVDTESGVLYRGQGGYQCFAYGNQNVTVTYVAGYVDPPRVARKVALNAVQGMWQASQQASHPLVEDFPADALGEATAALTPLEQRAYESLRLVNLA